MCNQRISKCPRCGFARHISWNQCNVNIRKQILAFRDLQKPPHPMTCEDLAQAEVSIWLRPRACPTDNEGCGGIRMRTDGERKDSGVSGVADDDVSVASKSEGDVEGEANIRSKPRGSDWDDIAVTVDSAPSAPISRCRMFVPYNHGTLQRPTGPTIKYAPDFVEAGVPGMRPNKRRIGMPFALHAGPTSRPAETPGPDIVTPSLGRYPPNPETSILKPWEIRDSTEPDETYLIVMRYHNIPEVRAEWAAKKVHGQERPVKTLTALVEEIFGTPQHVRPEE